MFQPHHLLSASSQRPLFIMAVVELLADFVAFTAVLLLVTWLWPFHDDPAAPLLDRVFAMGWRYAVIIVGQSVLTTPIRHSFRKRRKAWERARAS